MTREILLDSLCGQRRLAVIEDGLLCEMYMERQGTESLAGNIYAGHVENVLPGMNAAFVDIGLDKNAFLYAGDIQVGDRELAEKLSAVSIRDLVKSGEQILVQVVKEPGGTKGPRVSSHITLAGRLIVLLPTMKYVGVSRKLTEHDERARLRKIAEGFCEEFGCGMIIRTAAEGASDEDLRGECAELFERWQALSTRGKAIKAPALVMGGGSLTGRAVRDMLDVNTGSVTTDDKGMYDELLSIARSSAPGLADRIKLYSGDMPLFDVRGIDSQFEKALARKVWLKSGGYLVVDYTEALTVIDVNTGKFVGKTSLGDTIYKINLEAAEEIARQLRLRDIGGIVVVDFIDMDSDKQRDELLDALKKSLARDRTRTNLAGITNLGLVEITRKKSRQSAQKLMKHVCPRCQGEGMTDEYETVAYRVAYELRRRSAATPGQAYAVRVPESLMGAMVAVGAPRGVKAQIVACDMRENDYEIEPISAAELSGGAKLLRER